MKYVLIKSDSIENSCYKKASRKQQEYDCWGYTRGNLISHFQSQRTFIRNLSYVTDVLNREYEILTQLMELVILLNLQPRQVRYTDLYKSLQFHRFSWKPSLNLNHSPVESFHPLLWSVSNLFHITINTETFNTLITTGIAVTFVIFVIRSTCFVLWKKLYIKRCIFQTSFHKARANRIFFRISRFSLCFEMTTFLFDLMTEDWSTNNYSNNKMLFKKL